MLGLQAQSQRVRKHRAPKGALRLRCCTSFPAWELNRQKAPSAKRCIKTDSAASTSRQTHPVRKHRAPKGALRPPGLAQVLAQDPRQKAPSAKRCIKTRRCVASVRETRVRKHRAPKGALRPTVVEGPLQATPQVRKHRAPKGALRPECPWTSASIL